MPVYIDRSLYSLILSLAGPAISLHFLFLPIYGNFCFSRCWTRGPESIHQHNQRIVNLPYQFQLQGRAKFTSPLCDTRWLVRPQAAAEPGYTAYVGISVGFNNTSIQQHHLQPAQEEITEQCYPHRVQCWCVHFSEHMIY